MALTFAATSASVRAVLEGVRGRLLAAGLSEHACDVTELVLAEGLNNIVEHAYSAREEGVIELTVRREGALLLVELVDTGRPMPAGVAPSGRLPASRRKGSELPEGGFGWFIIRELAQDVHYSRQGSRNWLKLTLAPETRSASA